MSAHEISVTITRPHGERFERVTLSRSCGLPIPSYRRTRVEPTARDAAGFPVGTLGQTIAMRAQAVGAHARAGVLI